MKREKYTLKAGKRCALVHQMVARFCLLNIFILFPFIITKNEERTREIHIYVYMMLLEQVDVEEMR